jgi:hypothetical protein
MATVDSTGHPTGQHALWEENKLVRHQRDLYHDDLLLIRRKLKEMESMESLTTLESIILKLVERSLER